MILYLGKRTNTISYIKVKGAVYDNYYNKYSELNMPATLRFILNCCNKILMEGLTDNPLQPTTEELDYIEILYGQSIKDQYLSIVKEIRGNHNE